MFKVICVMKFSQNSDKTCCNHYIVVVHGRMVWSLFGSFTKSLIVGFFSVWLGSCLMLLVLRHESHKFGGDMVKSTSPSITNLVLSSRLIIDYFMLNKANYKLFLCS